MTGRDPMVEWLVDMIKSANARIFWSIIALIVARSRLQCRVCLKSKCRSPKLTNYPPDEVGDSDARCYRQNLSRESLCHDTKTFESSLLHQIHSLTDSCSC